VGGGDRTTDPRRRAQHVDIEQNAFVITGQALIFALQEYPGLFLKLGEQCISVCSPRRARFRASAALTQIRRLSAAESRRCRRRRS
jgi:hypothetical protein